MTQTTQKRLNGTSLHSHKLKVLNKMHLIAQVDFSYYVPYKNKIKTLDAF